MAKIILRDKWSATIHLDIHQPQPQYNIIQLNAVRDASGELISCDVNVDDFLAAVIDTLGPRAVNKAVVKALQKRGYKMIFNENFNA